MQIGGIGNVNKRSGIPPFRITSFAAALQTALTPQRAVGSATPTFTRNLASYVTDFEGLLRPTLANEARMMGARRVQNLVTGNTDTMASASATGAAPPTLTDDTGTMLPDGTTGQARKIVWPAAGDSRVRIATSLSTANAYAGSYWVRVTAGGTWQRIYKTVSSNTVFDIGVGDTGAGTYNQTVWLYKGQVENVTGQTNQNPSEYVSVGVLSAPYHGANVDGVRYFDTLNGNTVTSNVVTESTGAKINSSQAACAGGVTAKVVDASGPYGLLVEWGRQNVKAHSQDKASWTGFATTSITDASAVAPDGTTTMVKVLEDAATSAHSIYEIGYTLTASTAYTWSAVVAALGRQWIAMDAYEAGVSHLSYFDLTNGVTGTNAAGNTSTIKALPNSRYLITITRTVSTGLNCGFAFNGASADNTSSYAGDITKGFYWWGAQIEAASFASTYIPTTTAAVTRPADVDQYVSAGNIASTSTISMTITPSVSLGSTTVFHFGTYVDASNYTAILSDGTNLIARKRIGGANHDATIAWSRTINTPAKICARFDTTSGIDIWLNGTKGTNDATTTAAQIGTNFQIGGDGNGANQDFCEHRDFRAWVRSLPDANCSAIST